MKVAWNAGSTSPRRAWSPRWRARTRSRTTSPTPRRPATRPTAPSQGSFGNLLLQNTQTGQPVGTLGIGARIDATRSPTSAAQPLQARPASRSTSRSPARAGSPSRPPQGMRYTRNGQFSAAANGTLVDQLGNPVLGQNGQPSRVGADGTVDPRPGRRLRRHQRRARGRQPLHRHRRRPRPRAQVRSGALEGSGVDPTRTMVDMIASLRAFESGQKVDHDDRRRRSARPPTRSARCRSGPGGAPPPVQAHRPGLKFHGERPIYRTRTVSTGWTASRKPGSNSGDPCWKVCTRAAAGMAAQQQRIDAVANDLANVNTTGYKHVRVGFRDLLYVRRRPRATCAAAPARRATQHRPQLAQGALQRDRPARSTSRSRARASSASAAPTAPTR